MRDIIESETKLTTPPSSPNQYQALSLYNSLPGEDSASVDSAVSASTPPQVAVKTAEESGSSSKSDVDGFMKKSFVDEEDSNVISPTSVHEDVCLKPVKEKVMVLEMMINGEQKQDDECRGLSTPFMSSMSWSDTHESTSMSHEADQCPVVAATEDNMDSEEGRNISFQCNVQSEDEIELDEKESAANIDEIVGVAVATNINPTPGCQKHDVVQSTEVHMQERKRNELK